MLYITQHKHIQVWHQVWFLKVCGYQGYACFKLCSQGAQGQGYAVWHALHVPVVCWQHPFARPTVDQELHSQPPQSTTLHGLLRLAAYGTHAHVMWPWVSCVSGVISVGCGYLLAAPAQAAVPCCGYYVCVCFGVVGGEYKAATCASSPCLTQRAATLHPRLSVPSVASLGSPACVPLYRPGLKSLQHPTFSAGSCI